MKKIIILSLFAMLCGGALHGQQLPGDSLAADFKCLVKYLVETHPDPYTAFGGRVFFQREAHRIEQNLRESGATAEQFSQTALAFLARLEDGHTRISPLSSADSPQYRLQFPLQGVPAGDGLMATIVPENMKEFMGARIVSIGGVPTDELLERVARLTPVENEYGAYKVLGQRIGFFDGVKQLIPEVKTRTEVGFEFPSGEIETATIEYRDQDSIDFSTMILRSEWKGVDRSGIMTRGYVDKDKRMMLFRWTSIVSREAMEMARESNMSGWEAFMKRIYDYVLRQPMPEDQDEAIAALPSLYETFAEMLTEMKNTGAPYLVIDLRDNDGGFTPIVYQTLYQLYGEKYHTTPMGAQFYTMISPLYMQKYSTTLEEFNAERGSNLRLGEFLFESEEMPEVDTTTGGAIYTPERVFVLTNSGTFSAAFHYAFYLWKLGATLVGVPSQQAPNTFMEVTPFELPYTGIEGSISNAAQVFLPADDPRAKVFWPDVMLSPEQYARYGFDREAEILYLIDSLNLEKRL